MIPECRVRRVVAAGGYAQRTGVAGGPRAIAGLMRVAVISGANACTAWGWRLSRRVKVAILGANA